MNHNSSHAKVLILVGAVFALTLGVESVSLNSLDQAIFGKSLASKWTKKQTEYNFPANPYQLQTTDFPPEPVTIVAFGDLMLDRFVWTLMQRNSLNYPFEYFPELLSSMDGESFPATDFPPDFIFANLEGPISDTPYVNPGTAMVFNFRPDVIPILTQYGFNLFGIANNHSYDMGADGVKQTRMRLSDAGIHWVGEAKGIAEESQWHAKICGKVAQSSSSCTTLTFFAFNDTLQNRLDFNRVAELIHTAETTADFTIVSIHWGVEYNQNPTQKQVENAHKMVDAGADVIIGHHPHVIQKPANQTANENGTNFAEWYAPLQETSPRPIYYSLGNFIFDQYFRSSVQEGLGLNITLRKSKNPDINGTIEVKETVFDIVMSQAKSRTTGF